MSGQFWSEWQDLNLLAALEIAQCDSEWRPNSRPAGGPNAGCDSKIDEGSRRGGR